MFAFKDFILTFATRFKETGDHIVLPVSFIDGPLAQLDRATAF